MENVREMSDPPSHFQLNEGGFSEGNFELNSEQQGPESDSWHSPTVPQDKFDF